MVLEQIFVFLLHFSIFLLEILNIFSKVSCEAMLKISNKNIDKFGRKSKKIPNLVLSWLVLSWSIFVAVIEEVVHRCFDSRHFNDLEVSLKDASLLNWIHCENTRFTKRMCTLPYNMFFVCKKNYSSMENGLLHNISCVTYKMCYI